MSIPVTPNDPRVRIFVNDTWVDIYRKVRQSDGNMITIQTGNEDESLGDEIVPGVCEFILYNDDGAFTPDNPHSPYYPDLEVNTPVCVLTDEVYDVFSRTVASGWSDSTTGETYSTKSVNGVISGTDYSVDGSAGIHSVPAANAYRMTYFGSSSRAPTMYNGVQKIRYTPTFSDVTGGNIEIANLQCRLQSDTQYYMLRAQVTTAEAITLTIMKDDSITLAGPITVTGITHTIGQSIWFALGAFDDDLFVTAWQGDDIPSEPTGWLLKATDTTYGYGRYGVRTGVSAGNTNAKPIIAKYDHYRVYVSEFNGEIPDWPQETSDDGKDRIVPITAGGILRRYTENKPPLGTALRRYYERFALVSPDKYWPLEDGELTVEAAASVGINTDTAFFIFSPFGNDTSTEKHFGQAKLGTWMRQGAVAFGGDGTATGDQFRTLSANGFAVNKRMAIQFIRQGGFQTHEQWVFVGYYSSGVTFGGIDADAYSLEFNAFNKTCTIVPGFLSGAVVEDVTTWNNNVFDGAAHHIHFRFNETGGAPTDIFWELIVDDFVESSGTIADHPMMYQLVNVFFSVLDTSVGLDQLPSKPIGFGHISWFLGIDDPDSDLGNVYDAFKGYVGEAAETRLARLCSQQGIKCFNNTAIGAAMGPQYPDSFIDQLEEMVRTDGGVVNELMSARALHFYTLENIRTRTVQLTLDVSAEQVMPGWRPVRDNQRLKNKITASKRDGGTYTYTKTTGRLGTADPKDGGTGEYEDDVKTNPLGDQQLVDIAQREVSEGTVDKPRYPVVGVNLMAPNITNNLALRRQVLDMFVTARFKLTGMEEWFIYDDADLLIIGHKRLLGPHTHTVELNTIPFNSLDIFHVETAGSILGTNNSYITQSVDSDDTAFDVVTDANALWTTSAGSMPIPAIIEGEEVSVTNVVTTAPGFRSVGAAAHGDNATLNPALGAGQLAGDTLLCVSAIRNTTAIANTPAGYQNIANAGHLQISGKISTGGGESAPSCTFSGGAAGDTTSAFVIVATNCPFNFNGSTAATTSTNPSAQDILIPALAVLRANGIMFYIAWKQDDFTSVAPPLGLTEIIEASTVTGNDQSLYAAYRLVPQKQDSSESSFAVTGGASAISKCTTLFMANPQRLTVTRSINNVIKSHGALAAIRIAHPKVLG